MEPNESHSYFHHFSSAAPAPAPVTSSPPNGTFSGGDGGSHMVYPHSVPSSAAVSASPLEPAKRKRGRPRKYGTPEQALAAKKAATASSHSAAAKDKRDQTGASSPSYSAKKSQLAAMGNTGQGFTPHVINVQAGEDVGQKIMMFVKQSKREMCIISASGTISNASLSQLASSGGSVAFEGRFDIISLSGSYVRTENNGNTGGMSVCLSSSDGRIIGGSVGGPLLAAGPVQVIVGSFLIDSKKEVSASAKSEGSAGMKLPSPVGVTSPSSMGFHSGVESGMRNPPIRANEDQQVLGGSHFMNQPRGVHHVTPSRPSEWRPGPDVRNPLGYELSGRGLSAHHSPENGDYD